VFESRGHFGVNAWFTEPMIKSSQSLRYAVVYSFKFGPSIILAFLLNLKMAANLGSKLHLILSMSNTALHIQ